MPIHYIVIRYPQKWYKWSFVTCQKQVTNVSQHVFVILLWKILECRAPPPPPAQGRGSPGGPVFLWALNPGGRPGLEREQPRRSSPWQGRGSISRMPSGESVVYLVPQHFPRVFTWAQANFLSLRIAWEDYRSSLWGIYLWFTNLCLVPSKD